MPEGWANACQSLASVPSGEVHRFVEETFTPFKLSVAGEDKGLFTSYYASYVDVSEEKSQTYAYPIYRSSSLAKKLTRAEIERGALPESEVIYWARSAFDVYILQIQGSGVGLLPDGEKVNIAYAGKNSANYVSLGKVLRECGEIERSKISLPTIREWVSRASPVEYARAIGNNQSYVFFQKRPYDGEAPKGALGVPLTPMRSLAVDTRYITLGTLTYVSVPHPLGDAPIAQAFLAQDKGGAISGGIRADIFAGEGERAAEFAGRMSHYGEFWVLKPKDALE
ncbi:MAG: MltA domain-containing protein [Congregibacter sp.]